MYWEVHVNKEIACIKSTVIRVLRMVLYENIDQILQNKLYGPLHYKIGVTCVYNAHMCYTLL